jgi:hypothetical protein
MILESIEIRNLSSGIKKEKKRREKKKEVRKKRREKKKEVRKKERKKEKKGSKKQRKEGRKKKLCKKLYKCRPSHCINNETVTSFQHYQ